MAVYFCEKCKINHAVLKRCSDYNVLEDTIESLKDFNFYKQMILNGETDGRNVIIERKDGTNYIATYKVKRNEIPGALKLSDMERVTIFLHGKEYEFVACF
jgi:hypothetical protein